MIYLLFPDVVPDQYIPSSFTGFTSAPTPNPPTAMPEPTATPPPSTIPNATLTLSEPATPASSTTELLTSTWTLVGSNGAGEKDKVIPSNSLSGKTSVDVTFNLHGKSFGGGDDEASIVFGQSGDWRAANVTKFGAQNGLNGSQTVTIPITSFHKVGNASIKLDPNQPVSNLHARFWNTGSFTVDITSVKLIGSGGGSTPTPTATPTSEPPTATSVLPTPTPEPEPDIPSLNARVVALRFYERGYDALPRAERVYARSFASDTSRYINWELELSYPAPGRRIDFQIMAIYYQDNGTSWEEIHRHTLDAHVEEDQTGSYRGWGYGNRYPGNWETGIYRVDLYVEGKKIASEQFLIYKSAVTVRPDDPGALARYEVRFQTTAGVENDLVPSIDTIVLRFEDDFQVPVNVDWRNFVTITANAITGTGQPNVPVLPLDATVDFVGLENDEPEITITVPDMYPSDGIDGDGIAGGSIVTLIFPKLAGLRNPTEGNEHGYDIEISTSKEPMLASASVVIPFLVELSSIDGSRNDDVDVIGRGFKNFTTVTFWRDADGDGNRDSGELDLCSAVAGSDDMATCNFTITNPPFVPGVGTDCDGTFTNNQLDSGTISNCNYINAVDGRNNKSTQRNQDDINRQVFELDGQVTASPTSGNPGDTISVQLWDFPQGNVTNVTVGGVAVTPAVNQVVPTSGMISFTIEIPNGMPAGIQDLAVVEPVTGSTRHTNIEIGGDIVIPTTATPTSEAVGVATALAPLRDVYVRVHHLDKITGSETFYDNRPWFAIVSTLSELVPGQSYCMILDQDQTVVLEGVTYGLFAGWNLATWNTGEVSYFGEGYGGHEACFDALSIS